MDSISGPDRGMTSLNFSMKYPVPIPTAPPPLTDTERGDLASAIECFDFQGPTTLERIHLTLPVLIHLAFFTIDNYNYTDNAPVPVYRPRKATPATPRESTPEEIGYSKKFLKACVLVPRATVIRNTNLDSQAAWLIAAQRRFIQELLAEAKSKHLFEHYLIFNHSLRTASLSRALFMPSRAQTKTASPAVTIGAGGHVNRSPSVRMKVADRDQHCCKISGTLDMNDSDGDIIVRPPGVVGNTRGPLEEVAHGIPWLPRTNSDDDATMVMRIRESRRTLAMEVLGSLLVNVDIPERQGTHLDGQALLLDCPNSPVPTLDPAWFHLHWWLGDILYMAGGAEPRDFEEDDDSDEDQIEIRFQRQVTQTSIRMLDARVYALYDNSSSAAVTPSVTPSATILAH
ncbi:hypothetical protein DXG01_004786 [Tephrocybe rancida]|nr:hypothetical protein DXG01_004786 [Tephrocybe rancida]